MQIGKKIRYYRKQKNMTQESLANKLGVTTSAVNKWENRHSFPDITLLPTFAALFEISIDELFAQEELSEEACNHLLEEAHELFKVKSFEECFIFVNTQIKMHPNNYYLILWLAQLLMSEFKADFNNNRYSKQIISWYERVLKEAESDLVEQAAESLFYYYFNAREYQQAEKYLDYFNSTNNSCLLKKAELYRELGQSEEAYQIIEKLLFETYQAANSYLDNLYMLALKNNDIIEAQYLVDKLSKLANLFEMGEYHEVAVGLELALYEKDEQSVSNIVNKLILNAHTISDFTNSRLYTHLKLTPISDQMIEQIRIDIKNNFLNDSQEI